MGAGDFVEAEFELIAEAVALAQRVARAVMEKRDELAPEGFAGVTAMFLARAAQAATSAGMLARSGFNGDALSVARTALELSIDYPYISRAREVRLRLFTQEIHVSNWNLAKAINGLWDGTVDREKMEALEQAFLRTQQERRSAEVKHERNWAGVGLRERAKEVGEVVFDIFESQYVDMCNASHSCHASIQHVLVGRRDKPQIRFGPMPPDRGPVGSAFGAMVGLISAVIDACALPEQYIGAVAVLNQRHSAALFMAGIKIPR